MNAILLQTSSLEFPGDHSLKGHLHTILLSHPDRFIYETIDFRLFPDCHILLHRCGRSGVTAVTGLLRFNSIILPGEAQTDKTGMRELKQICIHGLLNYRHQANGP